MWRVFVRQQPPIAKAPASTQFLAKLQNSPNDLSQVSIHAFWWASQVSPLFGYAILVTPNGSSSACSNKATYCGAVQFMPTNCLCYCIENKGITSN